ncbi:MAG: 30S ribosome-binding factor RbfA [Rhodospirillales bacterium]
MSRREHKTPSQRHLRIGEELRHALADIIERGEIRDPGLRGTSITVTEVSVSPDLRNAVFYVIPLGGGDNEAVVEGLERAMPFLRRRVAEKVKLKYVPKISFTADTSFDRAEKIDALLNDPRVVRDIEKGE